jgi:hypothetical protein
MTVYISALFPTKNRLPALLIKVKACETRNRDRQNLLFFIEYQMLCTCQASDLSSCFLMQIGLDKLEGKSKGY